MPCRMLSSGLFPGVCCLTLSDPKSDLVRHYDFPVLDAFPHVVSQQIVQVVLFLFLLMFFSFKTVG
jgi:hypothetical protein